jgi:hypothetical protein
MKKTVLAITAGCLLFAGQAAATSQGATRIGDRVGSNAEASSEFAGIPIIGILAIAGVIAAAVGVATDDSDSD